MKKQALLFALCLVALNPIEVQAKEEISNYSTEDLKNMAKKFGKNFLDSVEEASDFVNDKISNIPIYKQESLWLITDIPNSDPSEKRHYYFVDIHSLKWQTITFYDAFGNQVSEDNPKATLKVEKKMYTYLNIDGDGDNFLMEYDYNLVDETLTKNYVNFNEEYTWDENLEVEYGRFTDVSLIIPEDKQKEKYSDNDLTEILEIVNDCEYELFDSSYKRERK